MAPPQSQGTHPTPRIKQEAYCLLNTLYSKGWLNHGPERKNVKSCAASNTIRNRGPHDPSAEVCHGQGHDISRPKNRRQVLDKKG
jgi:hypothetical protein